MLDVNLKAEALSKEEIVIHINGSLVISNAEKINSQLSSAISDYQKVTVKGFDIIDLDLSIIQLLHAFHCNHCSLHIELSLNTDLEELMHHSGFHFLLKN